MNHMGDPVTQWQIITSDPDKHASFYSAVFGWKIRCDNPLGYRAAHSDSPRGIAGGFWPAPPEATAFVQLFLEVKDIAAIIEKVTEKGGAVIIPPQTLPNGEQMAILRDPIGMSFGVMVPAGSDVSGV
jgi:predicted enzyme related to lactoylglutathione lyase